MKPYFVGIFVILAGILGVGAFMRECSPAASHHTKSDTAVVWVKYFDTIATNGRHHVEEAMCVRAVTNTFKIVKIDTSAAGVITPTKKWSIDTTYWAPVDTVFKIPTPKDSTDTSILKHPDKWTGTNKITRFILVPANWIIQDYNITEAKLHSR